MRHSNSGKKLGRTPSHRKALFRNMASAMITYGKIRTTEVKAKELRRVVEPLITLALRNDLHSRRLAYETLNDHKLVQRLFDVVAPPVRPASPAATPGSPRWRFPVSDCAPMAILEFTRQPEAAAEKN